MWPEDNEIRDIGMNEYKWPDLFSDHFEYHVEQISKFNKLLLKSKIMEYEALDVDYRYKNLYSGELRTRIYKICSVKYGRYYIGYTSRGLLCRYLEHICGAISGINRLSSSKVLDYGSSWIELLEEGDFISEKDGREIEGKYMRKYINEIVNIVKENRRSEERDDDYKSGSELKYLCEVGLEGSEESRKINSLARFYSKRIVGLNMHIKEYGVEHKDKIEKVREAIEDIRELKSIKKRIKDPKLAREELLKRKEMYKILESI
jgi:hypothetical protein